MAWKKLAYLDEVAALSGVAPVNVDHNAASAGAAAAASRQDHKHDLDEGVAATLAPVDGTAEALGTSPAVPHLDHIHALGPLVASLDFAQQQAQFLRLHYVDAPPSPATEVEGQIYFDSGAGDKHPYVWVT